MKPVTQDGSRRNRQYYSGVVVPGSPEMHHLDRLIALDDGIQLTFHLYDPDRPRLSSKSSRRFQPEDSELREVRTLGEYLDVHASYIAKAHRVLAGRDASVDSLNAPYIAEAHDAWVTKKRSQQRWWDVMRDLAIQLEGSGHRVNRDAVGTPTTITHSGSTDEFQLDLDLDLLSLRIPVEHLAAFVWAWSDASRLEDNRKWVLREGVINPLVAQAVERRETKMEKFATHYGTGREPSKSEVRTLQAATREIDRAYNHIVNSESGLEISLARRMAAARTFLDIAADFIEYGVLPETLISYLETVHVVPSFVNPRRLR